MHVGSGKGFAVEGDRSDPDGENTEGERAGTPGEDDAEAAAEERAAVRNEFEIISLVGNLPTPDTHQGGPSSDSSLSSGRPTAQDHVGPDRNCLTQHHFGLDGGCHWTRVALREALDLDGMDYQSFACQCVRDIDPGLV
jgi:hypothetical protein